MGKKSLGMGAGVQENMIRKYRGCRTSPLKSGVKEKPLIVKGGIGILDAALDVWAAKRGISFSGHWRSKKKLSTGEPS